MNRFVRWTAAISAAVFTTGLLMAADRSSQAADPSSAEDGHDLRQTRDVGSFDKIELKGAFGATITVGEKTRFEVSGPAGSVKRVTTEIDDGTLIVDMESGRSFSEGVTLAISTPSLRGFENSGTGKTTISGISGDDFDLTLSGAASITASGSVKQESITLDGTGRIDTTALEAGDVTVDNNGVGSVRVSAGGELVMNVSGVGEIRYTGNPKHVESNVSGVGRTGRI